MTYSLDLKERVLIFLAEGGSKLEATKLFKVSRASIYNWLSRDDLAQRTATRRKRKLDWTALKRDVEQYPDKTLKERARDFGVWNNAIWYALKEMGIKYKKNAIIQGKRPSKTHRISSKATSNN